MISTKARILAVLATLALTLALLPTTALAASFYDDATTTFDLTQLPDPDRPRVGGQGATSWQWHDGSFYLYGAGPYTLTGTAGDDLRISAQQPVTLILAGATFKCSFGTAIDLEKGGTVTVTADSGVKGGYGIAAREDLTIHLENDAAFTTSGRSSGIVAKSLSITGRGSVEADGEDAGVDLHGDLQIAQDCSLGTSGDYGLCFNRSAEVRGGGDLTASGQIYEGIYCEGSPHLRSRR